MCLQLDRSATEDGGATIETQGWLPGAYTDSFTSDRTLMTLTAMGEVELDHVTLMPTLDMSHVTEYQPAYLDSASNAVPARSIGVTEASVGLDFIMPLASTDGTLDLTGGIAAIYSSTERKGVSEDSTRARIDFGIAYVSDSGVRTRLSAFADGLGVNDLENFGAERCSNSSSRPRLRPNLGRSAFRVGRPSRFEKRE